MGFSGGFGRVRPRPIFRPHTTCVNRFNRWRKAGVWDRILKAVSKAYDGDIQMIDSSSIRVHQHAANAKKRRSIRLHGGRSRGGLTTKIHALVDAASLPIALKLTEGQAHDGRSADDMIDALVEGQILLADRAYDSDALRQSLEERGAWALRSTLYFSMVFISLLAMIFAIALLMHPLSSRLGSWNRGLVCAALFIAAVGAGALALPPSDEIPAEFPADVLWNFRIASLSTRGILRTALGLGFGAMARFESRHRDAKSIIARC